VPRPAPRDWYPRRGEVYLARLVGGKIRPAVVLSRDALNRQVRDVCVVPMTTRHHAEFSLRIPVQPPEGGLHRNSWIKGDQVHTLERSFLLHPPLGRLSLATLRRLEDAVRTTLQL